MISRKSFASIENKIHPETSIADKNFNRKKILINHTDREISKTLIEFINKNKYQISTGTGEWQWLENNKRSNYLECIRESNEEKLSQILANMFKNEATYGYISPSFDDIKNIDNENAVISDILSNIDTCLEFTDLKKVRNLGIEKAIGNPFGLKINNLLTILPDTPRHYYYSFKISNLLKNENSTILEIGGGFGGLAHEIAKKKRNITYIGIDLLPGLFTTYYFLKKNNHRVTLVNENNQIKDGYLNLIPFEIFTNKFSKIENIDLVFNSRSLCEMSLETIQMYFNFINRIKPDYIYHENSNFLLFPNSQRHLEILGSNFPVDLNNYKLENLSITPFTGGAGRYREFLYRKK